MQEYDELHTALSSKGYYEVHALCCPQMMSLALESTNVV